MAISLTCPSCERALKVKDELAGRKIKCPACGSVITVIAKEANSDARITAKKAQPARVSRDDDDEPEEEERPRKKRKKKGKSNLGLIIGGGAAAVVVIAVVAFLLMRDTTPKKVVQNKPAPVEPQPKKVDEPPPKEEPVIEKKAPAGAAARIREVTEVQNVLRQLGVAYRNFEVSENRGPKNQQELSPYYENNGQINEYLKNKWVTFIYGVRRQAFDEQGASNTILAYETDPDARGIRMVLFGDGSVNGLNEQDFKTSPKAKGK